MTEGIDLLELLREARRSAADRRKVFLAVYGLLIWTPLALLAVAAGRAALHGSLAEQIRPVFLRPVQATLEMFRDAFGEGRWALMALVVAGIWTAAHFVGSFFGLAVTRMVAIELTCRRRAEVGEAMRFARTHWYWSFLTPVSLLLGALAMLGAASLVVMLGRAADVALVVAAPVALVFSFTAAFLLLGLAAGGILAAPAIATEWSDTFDAITRVYGYSFSHAYRLFLHRAAALLALVAALVTRGLRALLVIALFGLVLLAGLGRERTVSLVHSILLEPADRTSPLPYGMAAWAILACGAIFLTALVARLLVFRLALRQAIYLLLRLRVDKVPMTSIDGYRPDDSAYDPMAQGFDLVEVQEEIRPDPRG